VERYTKLNLKHDVDDQAQRFGMSPDLEYRAAREPMASEESALSYLRLAPNFRMPFGHSHERQEEIYLLVRGSARLKLDDDVLDLEPWDAVRIAREVLRNLEAGPDGAELILVGAPRTPPGDAQVLQGWWSDD
jgi:mannose-6-phosphate isomerase-like protein (cupin superfamily)